ncbi:MAG: FAD-dependent oxidoreductase [Granulosicoccus sp.]
MADTAQHIEIIGAGVAGLCCARVFVDHGYRVTLYAASAGTDDSCCSWWAGGMLAPWCESESAEPVISRLGEESLEFWKQHDQSLCENGSLVVAQQRDYPELQQYAQRTSHFKALDSAAIDALEPDLAGRFDHALFYETECHLNPRTALAALQQSLSDSESFTGHFSHRIDEDRLQHVQADTLRIDCRGLKARNVLDGLRGVKGEMLILRTTELTLQRPVRLLHPRHPIYIVPRNERDFMVGATMIESDDDRCVSARSMMELLSSAYSLHPGFAEAEVVEIGTDARPAFDNNIPRISRCGNTLYVNGLYRHGFLCAPALARHCVDIVMHKQIDDEVFHEIAD